MQLITFVAAASTFATTVSAAISAVSLNADCNPDKPLARVVNRCSYPVYVWSVFKGVGCPTTDMVTLQTGEVYNENLRDAEGGATGISIKLSKSPLCEEGHITQLEYYLEKNKPGFNNNYLDVSYVDCENEDCPTRTDGYYFVAGNQTGAATAGAGNTWCPVMSCDDSASCASMSYINPDDIQTKTCDLQSNIDFYMCGGDAPSQNYPADPEPVSSSAPAPAPAPSSAPPPAVSSSSPRSYAASSVSKYKANAAAVTDAPDIKGYPGGNIKTEVVYVTKYIDAKKRHNHAEAHARRHQKFHA